MTREEFERRWMSVAGADQYTNLFVDAGMLKLDEPKDVKEMARGVFIAAEAPYPSLILTLLDKAGLKIVEK